MSRLTALHQRIKTAITIQKTTLAMRLTSMSTHIRLQRKKDFVQHYKQALEGLMQRLGLEEKLNQKALLPDQATLVVIIGSQKGLCGAFNYRLMHLVEEQIPLKELQQQQNLHIVSIGKKISEYLEQRSIIPRHSYPTFNGNNFVAIAHELEKLIFTERGYHTIKVYSNHPQTFFIQKSNATMIIRHKLQETPNTDTHDPYHYEQSHQEINYHIQRIYFKSCFEELLFNSLIAEQAARFIAMDTATRNADNMLTEMQRDYNKLRQASITRELTDLAGGVL